MGMLNRADKAPASVDLPDPELPMIAMRRPCKPVKDTEPGSPAFQVRHPLKSWRAKGKARMRDTLPGRRS